MKSKTIKFDGTAVTLRNGERFTPIKETVITFEKIRTLRFPSIFSRLGEVRLWNNQILGLSPEKCGLNGSPTRVVKSYESDVGRRYCQFVDKERLDELIQAGLRKGRVEQMQATGEKAPYAYFVGKVRGIAERIAKNAIEVSVEGKKPETIAQELREKNAKVVLWEDEEDLKLLAARVAVLTGAGICADCISFRVESGKFIITRPALGGNITADIVCESDMAFATVRTARESFREVIFSVGKGAVEHIERIKKLAAKYNAEICCSRIVADSGKMPYEKQVGLTGRTVSPKVYVAFGISGAVQHTCAISGAGTVIAVNNDKNARIFDYADYGIVEEVKNVKL